MVFMYDEYMRTWRWTSMAYFKVLLASRGWRKQKSR